MVFISTLFTHLIGASAMPTSRSSSRSNSTLEGNYTSHHQGGFQLLFDSTKDLAALVGLFATDGVERFTIDYTRGLLPPVTAPISLLGLLGYVQALLKLSFGPIFCERTGFSTASLRSYAGVSDGFAAGQRTDVYYLQRNITEGFVSWSVVKKVRHTPESMPLVAQDTDHIKEFGISTFKIADIQVNDVRIMILCGLCLLFATSLSSFTVVLLTDQWTKSWTWTRIFACLGMPVSVLLGGLPWCWIYIIEHVPFGISGWFPSEGFGIVPGVPDARKSTVAFFLKADRFYLFDCRAVSTPCIFYIRLVTGCAACCTTIAYICQYVELQSSSSRTSAYWLIVQGFLAIVRTMLWNWAPQVPGCPLATVSRRIDQRNNNFFKDSLTEIEMVLCWRSNCTSSASSESPSLRRSDYEAPLFPHWLTQSLDRVRLIQAFSMASRLRSGRARGDDLDNFREAPLWWDMPRYIFARWLQLRCTNQTHQVKYTAYDRRRGIGTWVCRIFKDKDGELHLVPGVSLSLCSIQGKSPTRSEVIVFSRVQDPNYDLLGFPHNPGSEIPPIFQGSKPLPNPTEPVLQLARDTLQEPLYKEVLDELWAEMMTALLSLGFG